MFRLLNGGIDLALEQVLDAETAWVSDIDKGANKVLAHRYPDVPNIGDMTAVDWSQVEPVDILSGGTPCQDLSHAGKRAGMSEGTRSNLWVAMREAIATIRPRLVVWENVRGAYSANADSEVEPCAGCVGDQPDLHLRALGRVLGDLADLGYDARWHGLRAADVGAPHGRYRVFVIAYAEHAQLERVRQLSGLRRGSDARADVSVSPASPVTLLGTPRTDMGGARSARGDRAPDVALLPTPDANMGNGGRTRSTESLASGKHQANLDDIGRLLPTPRATDGTKGGPNQRGSSGDLSCRAPVQLLPTPVTNDMGEGKTVEAWDDWTARMKAKHGNGNGHGPSLSIEAQRLLPTPTTRDEAASGGSSPSDVTLTDAVVRTEMGTRDNPRLLPTPTTTQRGTDARLDDREGARANLHNEVAEPERWGKYADAIARWEHLTREAPSPTEPGRNGNPRLSPAFTEWLMGLPDGWITEVPDITRNEALKLCGNGVVPQQCAAALRLLLSLEVAA